MNKLFLTILFALPLLAKANLELGSVTTEGTDNKALVQLELKNTFEQNIKGARVWVFLMDDEGKVVGNKAKWIIGGDQKGKAALESEKTEAYSIAVDTQRKATKSKITFSRLILEDGTLIDPRKHVISSKKHQKSPP